MADVHKQRTACLDAGLHESKNAKPFPRSGNPRKGVRPMNLPQPRGVNKTGEGRARASHWRKAGLPKDHPYARRAGENPRTATARTCYPWQPQHRA